MRYWWVNQNQTFRQEIEGGYLWSPKRNKNGHRNPFYEFMREVAPGDVVLSFCDTRIAALGIVSGYCRESPKPEEFDLAGTNWSQIGWRVGVRWQRLSNAVRPKDHIATLRPHLGSKYAPLTPEGNGLQSVYLTEIRRGFAWALFELIDVEAQQVADVGQEVGREVGQEVGQEVGRIERDSPAPERDIQEWERRVEAGINSDAAIPKTERTALVLARRGQGLFRDNVRSIEHACRITRVERMEHLIASHIQPWRDSVELGGAAQGLTRAGVARGFLRVMHEEHGEAVPALQFPQVREERGDLAARVLIDAVQTHEGIEDQQARLQGGDRLLEELTIPLEIESQRL